MKITSILLGTGLFFLGHIMVWFQLNGQFKWDTFKKYELLVAAAGFFISFFYMYATKYTVEGFGGLLWPARFVGFSVGITVYAILVSYFFNQGISLKTLVSLILCFILISIQVLWKN